MTSITTRPGDSRLKRIFRGLLAALFWLAVWQGLAQWIGREILLVSPLTVCRRLFELGGVPFFWMSVGASMGRVLLGFFAGVLAGVLFGWATTYSKWLNTLFYPLLSVVKATPIASLIILALCWLSSSAVPVFAAFLMVLPIVWENVGEGLRNTDPFLREMTEAFRFSRSRRVRMLLLPTVAPYLAAACTSAMGLAWKAGVAAEVLSSTKFSIGGQIYNAKIYIETADLFAWTAAVIILSILLEKAMRFLMRLLAQNFHARGVL